MMNPILWLTREIRSRHTLKHIPPREIHLDLGCGPAKYLLGKSPCKERIGIDQQCGQTIEKILPFSDKTIDVITMVAAIEHFAHPEEIIEECYRILKDDGVLIMTTPKEAAEWIIQIYARGYEKEEGPHFRHFTLDSMNIILNNKFFINHYKTFEFGLNQLFVCSKISDLKN